MILDGLMLVVITTLYKANVSYQWNPPSFISNWITIESPATENPEILHGFNEVPAKVDVQIKVVNNGMDYIFTGTGTTQRDNDDADANPLGGIVYVYNDQKVVLYPPTEGIGVAYTGSSADFNGPSSARGLYYTALVRVRAWRASDFPNPLFNLNISINDCSGGSNGCFREAPYTSADMPDLVVAQVEFLDGMISEGQGNIFLSDTADYRWALSGVVFGYDATKVKLWVPSQNSGDNIRPFNGALFSYGDGFGIYATTGGDSESSGTVRLKGYKLDKTFQTTFRHGTTLTCPNTITFNSSYDLDTSLVMLQVRVGLDSANNPGMVFNGAGSSMAGSMKYSGVVYAYNENSTFLYTPSSCNPNGYMVYLGDRWGDGQHPSSETSADVIVTVFSGETLADNYEAAFDCSTAAAVDCTLTSTDVAVTSPTETFATTTKEMNSFAPTDSQDSGVTTQIETSPTSTKITTVASTDHQYKSTSTASTPPMFSGSTGIISDGGVTNSIDTTSSTKMTSDASTASHGQSPSTASTILDISTGSTGMTPPGATNEHGSSTNAAGSRAIVFCPYDAVNLCECEVVQRLSNTEHHENDVHDHLYKIDKKKTSAYIRKHSSAYDGRFSAKVMGLTGAAVLVIVVLSIACLDMTRIKNIKKN